MTIDPTEIPTPLSQEERDALAELGAADPLASSMAPIDATETATPTLSQEERDDLVEELTRLIIEQRRYEASKKEIEARNAYLRFLGQLPV